MSPLRHVSHLVNLAHVVSLTEWFICRIREAIARNSPAPSANEWLDPVTRMSTAYPAELRRQTRELPSSTETNFFAVWSNGP